MAATVRVLDAHNNAIGPSLEDLAAFVALQRLVLSANRLAMLPPLTGCLPQLRVLVLDGNTKLRHLPDDLGSLHKLERLSAARCQLQQLPASLGQLQALKVLDVSYNHLSGGAVTAGVRPSWLQQLCCWERLVMDGTH